MASAMTERWPPEAFRRGRHPHSLLWGHRQTAAAEIRADDRTYPPAWRTAVSYTHLIKGTEQIAQEGAIQIFKVPYTGMEEVIVGVVGVLQFEVFQYRMKNEYGVDLRMEGQMCIRDSN